MPFAVVTGLKDESICKKIISEITTKKKHPLGVYTLPLPSPAGQFPGWTVPAQVKDTTIKLCKALNGLELDQVSVANEAAVPNAEGLLPLDADSSIQLHWEREEYRTIIESQDLMWPGQIAHKKLKLVRNRFPVVPEFDNKLRDDVYAIQDNIPVKKSSELKLKRRKLYDTVETSQYSGKSWTRKTMRADRQLQQPSA